MTTLRLAFFLFLCIAIVNCQKKTDIDSLISEVFPAPTNTNPPKPVAGTGLNLSPTNNGDTSCKTDAGEAGECVQYYLCNTTNNHIISDGTGIIDIRSRDGPCESYMEVCCLTPDRASAPITPAPPADKQYGCGVRNPDGVGFRIKGDKDNEAQFGEFNWMVAILREEPVAASGQKLNVYQCGGSLIHPKVVLTAAHCVAAKKDGTAPKLKVRAGEWDTQTKNEIYEHQDRNVAKIVTHEQYYPGGLFNDIAVLILDSPVKEAENVGVVCLPPAQTAPPSTKCFASGWGKDVFGKEGRYQVILKKVELPIVARPKCQTSLRKTRLGQHFELHKSFICAGGESGKDTCKGDGGSPLVCPIPGAPNRYMQSGIVAWGIGCGENGTPGVYANVAELREWIDEQMIYNNIDMEPYRY